MSDVKTEGVILNGSKKIGTFRVFDVPYSELRNVRIFRHLAKSTKAYHFMLVDTKMDSFGCEEILKIYQYYYIRMSGYSLMTNFCFSRRIFPTNIWEVI